MEERERERVWPFKALFRPLFCILHSLLSLLLVHENLFICVARLNRPNLDADHILKCRKKLKQI